MTFSEIVQDLKFIDRVKQVHYVHFHDGGSITPRSILTLRACGKGHLFENRVRDLDLIEIRCYVYKSKIVIADMKRLLITIAHNTYIFNFESTPIRFLYQCLKTGIPRRLMACLSREENTFEFVDLGAIVELWYFIKRRSCNQNSHFKRLLRRRGQELELLRIGKDQFKFMSVPEVQDLHIRQMILIE